MFNRFKRHPLLVVFFLFQFFLLSTYTFLYYQNDSSTDVSKTHLVTLSTAPENLPANLIEKSPREFLNENYKNFRMEKSNLTKSTIDLKLLNVSFVSDVDQAKSLIQCPILPPNLVGRLQSDLYSYEMKEIEEHLSNSTIQVGGHWSPSHCTARFRVAIIIPYRNREMQLRIFLNVMHPFLQKQQLDYQIFLIEPQINVTFNRALLFNIGFRQAMKTYSWQCFIFHDVDLIPEDDRNIYSCPPEPRHMSVAVNTMNYQLPYRTIFGGVSALTVDQFQSVNGFSNQYFGWGGEDDDMAARILTKYRISRYPTSIARYKMLRHRPDTPNQSRYKILGVSSAMRSVDGLSNLQYEVLSTENEKLFTRIRVIYNETSIRSSVAHIQKKNSRIFRNKTRRG